MLGLEHLPLPITEREDGRGNRWRWDGVMMSSVQNIVSL